MSLTIIGVDPSITKTGVVVARGDRVLAMLIAPPKGKGVLARTLWIAEQVARAIEPIPLPVAPMLLVIEGTQGPMSGNARTNPCVALRIRETLALLTKLSTLEVAPSTLKKFVTSHGNASKAEMGAGIMRHWGDHIPTDLPPEDVLEAFALLKFGACWLSPETDDWTEYQRVVAKQASGRKTDLRQPDQDSDDVGEAVLWPRPMPEWDFGGAPAEVAA